MVGLLRSVFTVWLFTHGTYGTEQIADSFVFVILNQEIASHYDAARQLASHIISDAKHLGLPCEVHVASEDWPTSAAWTYFPLLESLSQQHGSNSSWIVLLEEWTLVRLEKLVDILHDYNSTQFLFAGRGVKDREETIIHHFARVDQDHPFLFPDSRAGFVLSTTLLIRLAQLWTNSSTWQSTDFTIDAEYEFASFVKSAGVELIHHEGFCINNKPECSVVFHPARNCDGVIRKDDIHVAVKSCVRYHAERLPVIKATWLKDATNFAIYSDTEDPFFGTLSLGIPNTEHGHCGKTMAIIRRAAQLVSIHWLAIVDDDTLISVPRLRTLLSCYDSRDLIALGEKYGFAATASYGYDYITGGGGMVFSKALVEQLAVPGVCECPSNDTPDDMFLGMCLKRLMVPIIHSSAFHQARPMDYPEELLQGESLISFHKYWMVEPQHVFSHWLDHPSTSEHFPASVHTEL
ncbi:beta-1,3-glucosyltransferase isoform X1 [Panulirus ornatus]|uniref:beta-1,3-glucosyltransferase isoform X1 n=1 Tax=Panulirus ornatus TaxID=150431 RepID=UPI003A85CA81